MCVSLNCWSLSKVSVVTTQHNETIRGKPTQRGKRTLTQEPRVRGQRKAGQDGGGEEEMKGRAEGQWRARERRERRSVNNNKQDHKLKGYFGSLLFVFVTHQTL